MFLIDGPELDELEPLRIAKVNEQFEPEPDAQHISSMVDEANEKLVEPEQ